VEVEVAVAVAVGEKVLKKFTVLCGHLDALDSSKLVTIFTPVSDHQKFTRECNHRLCFIFVL